MSHSHTETQNTLSFQEKMIKLLDHWIKHNDDHSKTYIDWAEKGKIKKHERHRRSIGNGFKNDY